MLSYNYKEMKKGKNNEKWIKGDKLTTDEESLLSLVSDLDQRIDDTMQDGLIDGLALSVAVDAVEDELDELVAHWHDHERAPALERHLADVHDVLARIRRRPECCVRVVAHVLLHVLSIQVAGKDIKLEFKPLSLSLC